MAEQNGTPTAPRNPDSIITTQRNGQTIVAELFFNHSSTETFRDKLLKTILSDQDLSVRALNCLKAADVDTVGDLVKLNRNDQIGRASCRERV